MHDRVQKDLSDVEGAWKTLLERIGEGNDFSVFSIQKRKPIRYFHAEVSGDYIIIDRAKKHLETVNITKKRRVDFNQFRCVARLYNRYIKGEVGIRPLMRDKCGYNTSYVISLIYHLL